MKPLGKAMKIAHYEHQNKETVLNQLLTSYQANPHIATDQTLGNLFFQLDYQHNFHTAKPPTSNYIKEAHAKRFEQQQESKNSMHQDSPKYLVWNQDNLFW